MLRATPPVSWLSKGWRRAWPVFHAGWAGSASPGPAGHFGGPREAVLLTMQGIGGEKHAGQAQVLHQRRHGRDLAGRPGHLLVGQDEGGVTGKGAEHMSCGP